MKQAIGVTDPSCAVPSDGVAKEQAVSALTTVEEVEQAAFETSHH